MANREEVVDAYYVYNQPLYQYPDMNDISDLYLNSIIGDSDFDTLFMRHVIFRLNMGKIRSFVRRIHDGKYPYMFPTVYMYAGQSGGTEQIFEKVSYLSEGDAECFPDIPLRHNNVDFNDEASELDEKAIKRQLKPFGIKPADVLDEIFKEDSGVIPSELDHDYIRFGVRLWDESQPGREYLFKFFDQTLVHMQELGAITLEGFGCTVWEAPVDPEIPPDPGPAGIEPFIDDVIPSCTTINIKSEFTEYNIFTSGIFEKSYSMGEVLADEGLSTIYFSDQTMFTNGVLIKDYHSSSGEFLRQCRYTAYSIKDVNNFIDGNGKLSDRPPPEGSPGDNWLKPAVRFSRGVSDLYFYDFTGALITVNSMGPEDVYEVYLDGLMILEAEMPHETVSIVFYHIHKDGMRALSVEGLFAECLVWDGETPYGGWVELYLGVVNAMSVPIMFGLIENTIWTNNDSMIARVEAIVASIHNTIYVAIVEITEIPWYQTLFKIIYILIAIVLMVTGYGAALGFKMLFFIVAAEIVIPMAQALLGEFAIYVIIAVVVIMAIKGSYENLTTLFSTTAALTTNYVVMLYQTLTSVMNLVTTAMDVEDLIYAYRENELQEQINDQEIATSNAEKKTELFAASVDSSVVMNAVTDYGDSSTELLPIDPEKYLELANEFPEIGFAVADPDNYGVEQLMTDGLT